MRDLETEGSYTVSRADGGRQTSKDGVRLRFIGGDLKGSVVLTGLGAEQTERLTQVIEGICAELVRKALKNTGVQL